MSSTAKISRIKNKKKSKVLILGIIRFQYLRRVLHTRVDGIHS